MATIPTEVEVEPSAEPRNTRTNEIIAIALIAVAVLLALCLASYNPNDPSWNASGTSEVHNLIGAVGANVASALFQAIGVSAYLLPFLLIAAAWRRFRSRRIGAPISRVIGLVLLVLSAAALVTLANIRPLFDASFHVGGFAGAVIARALTAALNTAGATILLTALMITGILLATNLSFVSIYDRIAGSIRRQLLWVSALRDRMRARRQARREAKAASKVAATVPLEAHDVLGLSALGVSNGEARRMISPTEEQDVETAGTNGASARQSLLSGTVGVGTSSAGTVSAAEETKRSAAAARGKDPDAAESVKVKEMVREAAVRRKTEAAETGKLPFENGRRATAKGAPDDYQLPSVELLNEGQMRREQADDELLVMATRLAEKCREFNVTGQIKYICPGPVVTTYEFKPDPGVKYSRITGLVDDLCLALKAESIRIDRMPGKPHVGIEVPNPRRETIYLREVLESRAFTESTSKLTIALGKTIDGLNYVSDLARMPHLLIAGTTGSGKSVGVNSLLVSVLYRARPDEVKLILIDPKRLELGLYEDIPHLATPIITDPKPAARALRWAVAEMERRYKQLAGWGVRNIDGYNLEIGRRNTVKDFGETGEPWKPLPYIIIIIDELSDLMMVSGHEVEDSITRLAQMARAVGIHLVLATQRPSVDVITGLIKANFPSRISYRVSSKVDSRTILDTNGAEHLLGRGDMLFLPPGTSRLLRVHGAYVDEGEIGRVVTHIKSQWQPEYDESITQSEEDALGLEDSDGERDELFEDALRICVEMKRASTSVLQRRLRIGYGRAAALLDQMEREGMIGQADGARPRPVLGKAFELVGEWDEQEVDA
jgi:S-DNA-T family DNA segregation ATPase FtsK/SpoIIIE